MGESWQAFYLHNFKVAMFCCSRRIKLPALIEIVDNMGQHFVQRRVDAVVVLSVAVACYVHTCWGTFVFDDEAAVQLNLDVLGNTTISSLFHHNFWGQRLDLANAQHHSYRPLTILVFRTRKNFLTLTVDLIPGSFVWPTLADRNFF